MKEYKLRFDLLPPNANAYARTHWTLRHNLLRQWTVMAQSAASASGITEPLSRFELCAIFYVHRMRDLDNLAAMLKIPIDALRHARAIKNDSPRNMCRLTTEQVKMHKGSEQCLEIILREVESE